MSLLLSLYD